MDPREDHDAQYYKKALSALNDAGVPFMLGGAFAVYYYTNWWRNTHDVDVFIAHDDLEPTVEALDEAGFSDLGEQADGDHEWIYHAGYDGIIVDAIYRFANLSNYVTPNWFDRAPQGWFLGLQVRFLPLEELIWMKIFVINRHRCDWPDIMRLVRAQCQRVDWDRLLEMIGEHWLLLAGLVDVFDWQHPDSIDCIPERVRQEIDNRRKEYRACPTTDVDREHLLDPWIHTRADKYAVWRDEQPNDGPLR